MMDIANCKILFIDDIHSNVALAADSNKCLDVTCQTADCGKNAMGKPVMPDYLVRTVLTQTPKLA